jgi:hypothetical protein
MRHKAERLVTAYWNSIAYLAEKLYEKETMSYEEVMATMRVNRPSDI